MVKVSHYIKYENKCTFKDLVKIRFNRGLVRFSFTSCNADNLKSEFNWISYPSYTQQTCL